MATDSNSKFSVLLCTLHTTNEEKLKEVKEDRGSDHSPSELILHAKMLNHLYLSRGLGFKEFRKTPTLPA